MNLKPKRSLNAFDLSHASYGSCNLAQLIPVLCMDVVPGDTIDLSQIALLRFEAMTVPQYQTYKVKFHTFYLPERAMMPKYHDDFITGGKDGTDDTVWPHMVSPVGGYLRGSLGDYLGYTCNTLKGDGVGQTNQIDGTFEHSAYPNRMYARIINHYFLNENAEDEVPCSDDPGLDEITTTDIFTPNWQKTYETGVLPDTERGDPVYIPIGVSAPVVTSTTQLSSTGTYPPMYVKPTANQVGLGTGLLAQTANGDVCRADATGQAIQTNSGWMPSNLIADLREAISARYDEFQLGARVSYLQRLNMRAGYKLVEWTLAHFGVRVPDSTINEPIYLGGGSGLVYISPVEQTSATSEVSPQGNLAGRGTAYVRTSHIRRTFTQHGWVMTLMSIMPTPSYSQGLAKRFQRKTRWEYMLPVMDGAGDDKVMNNEIYVSGSNVTATDGVTLVDEQEFGYKPRNEEYRTMSDDIHGEMRKGGSLEEYTATRFFANKPVYGKQFVKADPSYRGFAVTDSSIHHVTYSVGHSIRMLRPLSLYGDPNLI